MSELWNGLLQWLHGIGLHPDPNRLNQAVNAVGDSVAVVGETANAAMAHMDMTSLMALAAGLGWASGFRLYAVTFLVGLMGAFDWLALPGGLHVLENPIVLATSGALLMVEFFADKVPWVDSMWDSINAFIRVPGGAVLAASVFGLDDPTMGVVAGLMGGSLAATSFATKATARAAINTSPEPFSNWGASLFEDGLVVAVVWLATQYPIAFGVVLLIMVVLSVLLLMALFRFLKAVWQGLGKLRRPTVQGAVIPPTSG